MQHKTHGNRAVILIPTDRSYISVCVGMNGNAMFPYIFLKLLDFYQNQYWTCRLMLRCLCCAWFVSLARGVKGVPCFVCSCQLSLNLCCRFHIQLQPFSHTWHWRPLSPLQSVNYLFCYVQGNWPYSFDFLCAHRLTHWGQVTHSCVS